MRAHIFFDETSQYGRKLRNVITSIRQSDRDFTDLRELMIQMRDGADNENDSSNYAENVRQFGFGGYDPTQGPPSVEQCDRARAAFLELDSAYAKTSGNGSVSGVRAARDQVVAILG